MSVADRAHGAPKSEASRAWVMLLVDDEADVIGTFKELVEGFLKGVTVLTASSGREGLEIMGSRRVDVVVSDFKMPGMDGIEFLVQVKMMHPEVKRMMFTAYADQVLARRANTEAGVDEFLSKNLDPSEFIWAVTRLIQGADS